jgi:hypothetical protein
MRGIAQLFLMRKTRTSPSRELDSSASPVWLNRLGNIDRSEGIRAFGDEDVAGLQAGQRLARAQGRQRAFETAQVDGLFGHLISLN